MEPTIYFVIPCYNEEAVLPETTRRLAEKLQAMQSAGLIGKDSRVLYVDDGSKDKTWQLISQFHQEYPWVEGVKLAPNRGHQNALLCGLMTAKDRCDCAISLDAATGAVSIDPTQCNGCGLCVGVCPFGAIEKEED